MPSVRASQIVVGSVPALVGVDSSKRIGLYVRNADASVAVRLGGRFETATTRGLPLRAGESFALDALGSDRLPAASAELYAVAESATVTLDVLEVYR